MGLARYHTWFRPKKPTLPPDGRRHVMVVFHATFPHTKGGINVMIAALIQEWSRLGVRVSLFVPGEWHETQLKHQNFGSVTLYRMRLRPWHDARHPWRGRLGFLLDLPRTLWRLYRLTARQGVDLLHFHTPRAYQFHFQLLAMLGGPPGVLTFHGTDALEFATTPRANQALLHWIARRCHAITAVASHYARLLATAHPELCPIHHIPNGIEPLDEAALQPPPMPLPACYWIMVGWIEPPKAQDVAIRAWAEVVQHHPDLHLLILGSAPELKPGTPYYPGYLEEIQTLAATLGCASRILWPGNLPRSQVLAIMRQAEGLIFPSHREGLPYVLLEAGLTGLPVVCNQIPPFTDLLEPDKTGLLTPDSDPQALAAAVMRLHADPDLRHSLATAWQTEVRNRYSLRAMAAGYLTLFATLTGRPFPEMPP